ncbi:beta/gamma crystallin-related protein [Photobacterium phosphoreum]|nr:beta/gamma crystallin-related protein [Photobacterium phosphoreum]
MKKLLPLLFIFSPFTQAEKINYDSYVRLYENGYYHGRSMDIVYDIPNFWDFNFNDILSSIEIPSGWTVTLYEDMNYQGKNITVQRNSIWLANFNDRTSSIRIVKDSEYQ